MRNIFLVLILVYVNILTAFAGSQADQMPRKIDHVIYITLDGTRWQDLYLEHIYFQKLWDKYAKNLKFYGMPASNSTIETASIPISMPSYQSQMAGAVQPCQDNYCGRIKVETFPERLISQFHGVKKEVAIFSSWEDINLAAEHISDTTVTNTGNNPMHDPLTHLADPVMAEINKEQAADPALENDRYDRYTYAQALHYFKKYRPHFLWISLGDADEWAHANNILKYHETLKLYDDSLDILFTTLKNLNIDKNTMVIVTTDHGRGNGDNWTEHGPEYPESKQTWAFVFNGDLKPISQNGSMYYYNTLSIRPTVENALQIQS